MEQPLSGMATSAPGEAPEQRIAAYWNTHIHDLALATQPIGSLGFFQELDAYRYEKLAYLPGIVDFPASAGKKVLEVGCGVGTDLVRFALAGAEVTGVELADTAIELARQNLAHHGLRGELYVMDGRALRFADDSFDIVYAHGLLQYTAEPQRVVSEIHRVLRPGGRAILMVYNRYSWLNLLSLLTRQELEHEDAPFFRKHSIREFRALLTPFPSYQIIPERFPVRTRLHSGMKARLYNDGFVRLTEHLPARLIRPLGWHLIALAHKLAPMSA
jgi:SAM-dependent methyltransferase